MKTDAEILAESGDYIREHGWTQGTLLDRETDQVCGLGGICISQDWLEMELGDLTLEISPQYQEPVKRIVSKVLMAIGININPEVYEELEYSQLLHSLTNWNDMEERTEQEVLDAFAKAEKIELAGFDPEKGMV
jgi:hypothetical protein